VVGAAVEAHGGEILKFIGDAVLAIFPCSDGGPAAACRRALGAARTCLDAMEAARSGRSVEGRPHLEAGIALHLGEVMYGNIGSANRLDFTVIGAAVNVASRTESMCKALGVPLVLTDAVARHLDPSELVGLGVHPLRGVSSPVALFTAKPAAIVE
jgi:adenylate cyclase